MHRRRLWLSLTLLIPFIALLWVPSYNAIEPRVAGFPFFYVWLMAWIIITSVLTWLVFKGWRS